MVEEINCLASILHQPTITPTVPTLSSICQDMIVSVLEESSCCGRTIHDLCRFVPDNLLETIFERLLARGTISETALVAFLVPNRLQLRIISATQIRKSIFKQIGYNCPHLVSVYVSLFTAILMILCRCASTSQAAPRSATLWSEQYFRDVLHCQICASIIVTA